MEGAHAQHGKSSVYVGFRLDRSGVFWTAERHPTYKQAATKNQPEISVRRIGVIATPGTATEHFAGTGFIIRAQTEPGSKTVLGFKGTQVITQLGHQRQACQNANTGNGR
jgi:hypothetical protein